MIFNCLKILREAFLEILKNQGGFFSKIWIFSHNLSNFNSLFINFYKLRRHKKSVFKSKNKIKGLILKFSSGHKDTFYVLKVH